MKKTAYLFLALSVLFFSFTSAQTSGNWKPLWLSTTNVFKGVEGFYQSTTCNGSEVVLIKLVNHNNYSVKTGWKNLLITNDDQKLYGIASQDSVVVAPNAEVAGECLANNTPLVIKLSDLGAHANNFKAFFASDFNLVVVH
jgi:hypothetical protein